MTISPLWKGLDGARVCLLVLDLDPSPNLRTSWLSIYTPNLTKTSSHISPKICFVLSYSHNRIWYWYQIVQRVLQIPDIFHFSKGPCMLPGYMSDRYKTMYRVSRGRDLEGLFPNLSVLGLRGSWLPELRNYRRLDLAEAYSLRTHPPGNKNRNFSAFSRR